MAVWGQGDPRWIVEHRDDGKNVNNWHWSEVNKMDWTKQRLAELLPGTEAPALHAPSGASRWTVRVSKIKSVTGEAMLTTRKGNKRFAFYDLKLTLAWEAICLDAATEAGDVALGQSANSADAPTAGPTDSTDAGGTQATPSEAGAADSDGQAGDNAAPKSVDAKPDAHSKPKRVKGEITVAEFGSGSDHDDIEVSVTATGGEDAQREQLRQHAQVALWPLVLERLEQYVRELAEP